MGGGGPRKIVQKSKALVALPEDPDLIPSNPTPHNCLQFQF